MILAFRSFTVRHIAIGVGVLSVLLFLAADAAAQASRVGATLEGIVRDTSGAVIPNSIVTLQNPSTNQSRTVATDGQGFFRAQQLASGTYDVQVEQIGFAPYRQAGVGANLGQTVHLDIVLGPASASEQLTVNAFRRERFDAPYWQWLHFRRSEIAEQQSLHRWPRQQRRVHRFESYRAFAGNCAGIPGGQQWPFSRVRRSLGRVH